MKTNHQRGFVARTHRNQAMYATSATAPLSDKCFGSWVEGDFTNGNRGMARAKRGVKKFVRTRVRRHENWATRRIAFQEQL